MNALVLNTGSSSVKFALLGIAARASENSPPLVIATGSIKGIGGRATLDSTTERGAHVVLERSIADQREALEWTFEHLRSLTDGAKGTSLLKLVNVVGHRIVHGGDSFQGPVRIDDAVITTMESLSELAPLHNPAGVAGIRAAQEALGPGIPHVAVFDTAFHHGVPARASTYAIPLALAARHRIRRYGFHGIAHASLLAGYATFAGKAVEDVSAVIFHLGNGCSATAVRQGRSIDTSMGFTPLEGLVMGTRSGDIDPTVVSYLARYEGVEAEVVERWLNERSGLLGISGRSRDMSALLDAAEQGDDQRAALAIDVFCYRGRKYLGGYLAALGGADAVIFGGGIGENVPRVRAGICENMQWCGLSIDNERNARAVGLKPGGAARISPDEARLPAYVIPADEESWIAREAARHMQAEHA